MSEVKWIKITTNMFEDEKIDFIESLPESDAILVIWLKLLAQAGKTNSNGFIFLTEQIPYTDEMLAHKFRRSLNVVKLALQTLKQLEMIQYNEEGFLKIANWEKHQNIEGLDKIREQTRLRVEKHREKQKELEGNKECNVTVTQGNETELEVDKIRIDIDKIILLWNNLELNQLRNISKSTTRYKMLKARVEEYSIEDVEKTIESISNSSFLKGDNNKNWTITFDWLVKPNNFIKVLEGNYTDKGDKYGGTKGNSGKDNEEEDKWNIGHLINRA